MVIYHNIKHECYFRKHKWGFISGKKCLIPHLYYLFPEFIWRELSSYQVFIVIWGKLWNSYFLDNPTNFVLTTSFFKFAMLLNTGWMSILENTLWKRGLLINFTFSNLKILLISSWKGRRLLGKTKLCLPFSWKTVVNTTITHK